jgi:arylsulfatase A-like enzyme
MALFQRPLGASCLLLGVVLAAACAGPLDPPPARHVVVISLDTTRADHFGFMGSADARTPRTDALAAESIVLTDVTTVAPTTLASHTSLFTGRYPHHHGTPRNGFTVHPDNQMLPEILKAEGFHTAGFAGSFALDSRFDFPQGFDHYDESFDIRNSPRDGIDQNQRSAARVTDAALDYLDATGVPDRLFLFAHYFDAHRPYDPPPEFLDPPDAESAEPLPSIADLKQPGRYSPGERTRHALRYIRRYAAEISSMDAELGRLFDGLRERGVLDDAILILTSDHGETFLEHRELFDHGTGVYQTTMHALGVIRLPNRALGGTRVAVPASTIDLLPTALAWLGLAIPDDVDGVALPLEADALGAHAAGRQFGQATKPIGAIEDDQPWANLRKARFVRQGPFKLVQIPYLEREELFHLASDPDEQHDLLRRPSAQARGIADELRPALESWARTADPLPSSFAREQEDDTIRRLRSLGYVR